MRCRKVRSFLSAYSNDELVVRKKLAVSEHLSTCSSCRKQEAVYRSMNEGLDKVSRLQVSDDFNARLLDRVARERFSETRTKAWFPKPIPFFRWSRVVPVVVSTCALALAIFIAPSLENFDGNMSRGTSGSLDDSYLVAQPAADYSLTDRMNKDWSLASQLERTERVSRISNGLTQVGSFGHYVSGSPFDVRVGISGGSIPFVGQRYNVRPVIKLYVVPQSSADKEDAKVY